ncbi:DoxX family protein [Pontibacter toksunensis]|uniref:DoxX family protein n=1 Tax=Pontibacter toksunensis TaxID=1332631 RepID=A0ABW6BW65_9BACT
MNTSSLSYLLARLPIALSMFGHGLVRLPKLNEFSNSMVGQFESTWLPTALVSPFSYVLPFLEFTVGVLLILGLFTRTALVVGALLMLALIFGSSLLENWSSIATQMFYGVYFAGLLFFEDSYNHYSLDHKFSRGD